MPRTVPSLTRFLPFRSRTSFRFEVPNASQTARQSGKAGTVYLTNIGQFTQQALAGGGHFELAQSQISLPCLPPEQWATADLRNKTLLVLLPTQALGDCTQALMALHALRAAKGPKSITVACAGAAHDIFATNPFLNVRPLWFAKAEADRADCIVDLAHMLAGRHIDLWPVDFEGAMLEAFAIPPSSHYAAEARSLPTDRPLEIGLFPLASSPLRTLPPAVVRHLAGVLAGHGNLTVSLNTWQEQGRIMQRELQDQDSSIRILDNHPSIGSILESISRLDYAVFADSGPAHVAKLFATPGTAIYTSAPSHILQGRFRNLAAYDVDYSGAYCSAPCGLAKVREATDGRIGCMGSLRLPLDELPSTPSGRSDAAVRELMADPVPCVKALAANREHLAAFIEHDIQSRLRGPA